MKQLRMNKKKLLKLEKKDNQGPGLKEIEESREEYNHYNPPTIVQ